MSFENIMKCYTNPFSNRILMTFSEGGSYTAKELLKIHKDIAPATLYRKLKELEEAELIEVIEESKVRALTEKTYAVTEKNKSNLILDEINNNGEMYTLLFANFMNALLIEFKEYATRENIDIKNDGSAFGAMPIYITESELEEMTKQIKELISRYTTKTNEDQNLHTLAIISTPPRKEQ